MDPSGIAFRFELFKNILVMYCNVCVANNKESKNYAWADGPRLACNSWVCIEVIVKGLWIRGHVSA